MKAEIVSNRDASMKGIAALGAGNATVQLLAVQKECYEIRALR
jgi:hypothetical protein